MRGPFRSPGETIRPLQGEKSAMKPSDVATQYDHVAIAVKDIDQALHFFHDRLCAEAATPKHHSPEMNMYIAEVVLGRIKIELIQDADPAGPIAKFIEKKGEGLHHVSILVDDIQKLVSDLEAKEVPLIGKQIDGPGDKWVYVSPKASFGALIQYWQYA